MIKLIEVQKSGKSSDWVQHKLIWMDCFGFRRIKVRILRKLYKYPLGMVNINLMLALEMNSCYDKQQNIEVFMWRLRYYCLIQVEIKEKTKNEGKYKESKGFHVIRNSLGVESSVNIKLAFWWRRNW
jgi:hypothetical protein